MLSVGEVLLGYSWKKALLFTVAGDGQWLGMHQEALL